MHFKTTKAFLQKSKRKKKKKKQITMKIRWLEYMGYVKSSSKREVYSNKSTSREKKIPTSQNKRNLK